MMPKVTIKCCRSVLILVMLQFLSSCATNPVTGKRELNLLSESQEIQLGAQADPAIVAEYGLYDDEKLSQFIDDMGQKMAKVSHRPHLKFTFRVLDSPVINAFALPGGYVYFTRGILGYMNSEAEVAGVLGHEIGHVTARHGAKAYTRAQLAQVGLGVGSVVSETFREYSGLAQTGIGLIFLKFGRNQESQSDQLGVSYSTQIGYDAANMSHFFGTLNRLQAQSAQSLPGWFSTHPNPADREARTLQLAKDEQSRAVGQTFKTAREPYLSLIDGIIFGDDPRQGFVDKGIFYHPTLDFEFPVPNDWLLVNSPQSVQMANKEQTVGLQFTLAQEPSARAAAQRFISESKATITLSNQRSINGNNTEIRESTLSTQQGDLRILSYFIEKGDHVYIFHGFGSLTNYGKELTNLKTTMNGFRSIRSRSAKKVKATRIKIVRVTQGGTLESFLGKHPSKNISAENLAIVNGMKLSDRVRPGDRIKVLTQ